MRTGTDWPQANLTAHAGVTVFTTAYDRWIDGGADLDLPALMQQSLDDLRRAIQAA